MVILIYSKIVTFPYDYETALFVHNSVKVSCDEPKTSEINESFCSIEIS